MPPKPPLPPPRTAAPYLAVTQRPLQCLAFLLPLLIVYELGLNAIHARGGLTQQSGLAAPQLLHWFFSLFGATGYYLPGLALAAVLVAWHAATREPWRVETAALPVMAGESAVWAVPLYFLNDVIRQQSLAAWWTEGRADDIVFGIGAGIYEEMVFRLIVITAVMSVAIDVLKVRRTAAVAAAVIVSSLLFSAHHYPPVGTDPFEGNGFLFRSAAGAYLAAVFVLRGFGIAVGAHVAYNIMVVLLERSGP